MIPEQTEGRKRIVIVGGGFGGAYLAQRLEADAERLGYDVLLLDRRNYFVFYPLLVEAGTGSLEPRHAVVAIRDFLRRTDFLMAELTAVDAKEQVLIAQVPGTEIRHRIPYDHLVLALGSVTRMPPVPGLKEYGFEIKTIGDSVALRDRGLQMLEIASGLDDPAKQRELLHFVVVGANYTGVEIAGEFQAFLNTAARRRYKSLGRDAIRVTLVELADRILPVLDEDLANYAAGDLKRRGIDIRTGTSVSEIHEDHAILRDGTRLPTRTVVWAAGIAPPPLLKQLPFPVNQRGYLECERTMNAKGFANVWGIGDCAFIPDAQGNPHPPTAQHAIREADRLAENLRLVLQGRSPEPCDVKGVGSLAAMGCYSAVAKVFGIKLTGFPAWFLWRSVYLMKMPTLSRKFRVALDWTADLFIHSDTVQLGVHRIDRVTDAARRDVAMPTTSQENSASATLPEHGSLPDTGKPVGAAPDPARPSAPVRA